MFKVFLETQRAQVTLFFLSLIATLIVLAFIVIMVGKTVKDKTFADNAADSGALAACSIMAQAFNDNSADNGQREEQARRHKEQGQKPQNNAARRESQEAHISAQMPSNEAATPPGTPGFQAIAKRCVKSTDNEEKYYRGGWRQSRLSLLCLSKERSATATKYARIHG